MRCDDLPGGGRIDATHRRVRFDATHRRDGFKREIISTIHSSPPTRDEPRDRGRARSVSPNAYRPDRPRSRANPDTNEPHGTVDAERRRRASPLGAPRAMRVKERFRSSRTPRATSRTVASFASRPDDDSTRDRDPGFPRSRYERIRRSNSARSARARPLTRSRIVDEREKRKEIAPIARTA